LNYAKREPDIILYFESWTFDLNKEKIGQLRRGDLIYFNATITYMGSRSQNNGWSKYSATDEIPVHHFKGLSIRQVMGERMEIDAHVHWDGRYQFNEET